MTMSRSDESLRRVAILVASLDAHDADIMLDRLPLDEAATVVVGEVVFRLGGGRVQACCRHG